MVRKLLERAIEIEGLLRIIRDGNPLPETYTLLNDKTLKLSEGVKELAISRSSGAKQGDLAKEMSKADTMIVIEKEQSAKEGETKTQDEETRKLIDMTVELQDPIDEENQNQDRDELAEVEDDTVETTEAIETVQESEIPNPIFEDNSEEEDDDIMLSFEEDDEEEEESPGEKETIIEIEENDAIVEKGITEKTELEEPLIEIKQIPVQKKNEEKSSSKRQNKLKSAFSLNDRFFYSRELFDGNMKMFDSALNFIEGIDDFRMIEDYFYKEMELDPENTTVASFMEIIKGKF